jgi:hypothetical protein
MSVSEIARTLTPAMRDELTTPNPGEGDRRVVGALVRRHLLTPEHMGSMIVYRITALGQRVLDVLSDQQTARTLPQHHCPDRTDHSGHPMSSDGRGNNIGYRCPGRHTPSKYRAPHVSPAVPTDPFAGIDDSTEFDATRPAVS